MDGVVRAALKQAAMLEDFLSATIRFSAFQTADMIRFPMWARKSFWMFRMDAQMSSSTENVSKDFNFYAGRIEQRPDGLFELLNQRHRPPALAALE